MSPRTGLSVLPLLAAQSGMWYAQELDPANPTFNVADYLDVRGPIDIALLIAAVRAAAREADAVHMTFRLDAGVPVQLPVPPSDQPVTVLDLRAEANPEAAAQAWMAVDLALPIDPTAADAGILGTVALLRVEDDRLLWYQRAHHLILDGYAAFLLVQRVAEHYEALVGGVDAGPCPFGSVADLIAEEQAYVASVAYAEDRAYWAERLADRAEPVSLSGRVGHPSHAVLRHVVDIAPEQARELQRSARAAGVAWPTFVIAATAGYLHRMTAATEVTLGLPLAVRKTGTARTTPGMLANALPLALTITPGTTVSDLVRIASTEARGALKHQRYRGEQVRRDLRAAGRNQRVLGPMVNIMPPVPPVVLGGHAATLHNLSNGPVEDMAFVVYDLGDADGMRVNVNANPGGYTDAEVARHARRFVEFLAAFATAEPGSPVAAVPIVGAEERAEVLALGIGPVREITSSTLPQLVQDQVAATPAAVALIAAGQTITYRDLNASANQIARLLVDRGAGPGTIVAFALPHGADAVRAMLAIAKTGAAYLPIDPEYPARRIELLLGDAAPVLVVTDQQTSGRLTTGEAPRLLIDLPATAAAIGAQATTDLTDTDRTRSLTEDDPAYVIYTSGSTGTPKGVVVGHRSVVNYLSWCRAAYPAQAGTSLLPTSFAFDLTVTGLFGPLVSGGRVRLERLDDAGGGTAVAESCTFLKATPSHLPLLGGLPAAYSPTDTLILGGETLTGSALGPWRARHPEATVINAYGPTEATVNCAQYVIEPGAALPAGPIPIGRPLANTRLYVLDAARQPVPLGAVGELHVGGAPLAHGYLRRPDATADRFVDEIDGAPGARMYRTGDLVRWSADGNLMFVGRADDQVKVRGHRIEPGEVVAALVGHPDVTEAAVIVREDRPGDQRLVGYVVPSSQRGVEPADVLAALARQLPAPMVPAALTVLDRLPLNAHGKLDRAALPAPAVPEIAAAGRPGRDPRDARETTLCRLFAETLGLPAVSIDDDFFDCGGHSILAGHLMSRVRQTLDAQMTIRTLFEAPTVADLAARIGAATDDAAEAFEMLLPLRTGGADTPLFCLHPAGGLSWCYSGLPRHLGSNRPVYGIQAGALSGRSIPASIEEMADEYRREIERVQPTGPYHLLGWSFGGAVAHLVATGLQRRGTTVASLTMLDSYPQGYWDHEWVPGDWEALHALLDVAGCDLAALGERPLGADGVGDLIRQEGPRIIEILRREGSVLGDLTEDHLRAYVNVFTNNARLQREFAPDRFDGDLLYFTATIGRSPTTPTFETWDPYITGRIINHPIASTHNNMTRPAPLAEVGTVLAEHLAVRSGASAKVAA